MAEDLRLTSLGVEYVHVDDGEPRDLRLTSLGVEYVHKAGEQPNDLRLSSLGLEYIWIGTRPNKPTVEAEVDGTTLFVSTSEFSSEDENADHSKTLYQVQESGGDWTTLLKDEETEDFLTAIVLEDLPTDTDVEVRALHVDRGFESPWSDAVEVTTGLDTPRPETPTVTVEEFGFDLARISLSDFDHAEGVTTAEDWDPDSNDLPYPIAAQIRIRRTSDGVIVADTELSSIIAEEQEAFFDDLDDDEDYEAEGRWQDGKYGATSEWSAAEPFSTDPIPPDRPAKPTISLDVCARAAIELSSGPYGHDDPGGVGADHVQSQWRVCVVVIIDEVEEVVGCSSRTTNDPNELLAFEFAGMHAGLYRFQVRHGDELDRWGEWSDESATCEILPLPSQPRITSHVSGISIDSNIDIQWEMEDGGDWEYRVRLSTDEGEGWSIVAEELTEEEYQFKIAGRPNGYYLIEITACYPQAEGGECGDPIYLALYLDRTGQVSVTYNTREMETFPGTWEEIHNTSDTISHKLVDADLQEFDPEGGCDPCQICEEDEHGNDVRRPAGILSQVDGGLAIRSGFLAFKELGKPTIGDVTTAFSIVANDAAWWGWRFSQLLYLRGGIGWKGAAGGQGLTTRVAAGSQAWPFPHPTGGCDGGGLKCNCGNINCQVCTEAHLEALPWIKRSKPNTIHEYRIPWGEGTARLGGSFFFGTISRGIPRSTIKTRGLKVAARQRSAVCCWDFPEYTMRQRVTRTDAGGLRVRVQILGPGIDPEAGWIIDEEFSSASSFVEACGYCGLSLWHIRYLVGDPGLLTKSISVILPEGFEQDGPTLGPPGTRGRGP